MSLWAGMGGHDYQQLAQRGWSQQAVLLWHSWGENVPGTWLAPWGELADGIDAGVCIVIYWAQVSLTLWERTQRRWAPAGEERKRCQTERGSGKRTPMDWAGEGLEGSQYAPGRQMFQLIRAYKAGLHTLPNNWIIYVWNVCIFLEPVSNPFAVFSSSMLLCIGEAHAEHTLQTASLHLYVLPGWALFRTQTLPRVSFTHRLMSAYPWGPLSLKCHWPRLLWAHTKVTSDTGSRAPYWFPIYHHYAWQFTDGTEILIMEIHSVWGCIGNCNVVPIHA